MRTTVSTTPAFLPAERDVLARREFVEVAKAIAISRGGAAGAVDRAAALGASSRVQLALKASVPGMTPADGDALAAMQALSAAFISGLPSVFDTMIPAMLPIPLLARTAIATAAYIGSEVTPGAATPVGKLAIGDGSILQPATVAAFLVISRELARTGGQAASTLIERALRAAVSQATDKLFLGLLIAATSPLSSTGNSVSDIDQLLAAVPATGGASLFFIFRPEQVRQLANARATGGGLLWPAATATGGSLAGVRLLPSDQLDSGVGLLVDASQLAAAPGEVALDQSNSADVLMDDSPTMSIASGSPPAPVPASQLVSMFQTDSTAIRATRTLGAKILQAAAVASLTGANYSTGSPS